MENMKSLVSCRGALYHAVPSEHLPYTLKYPHTKRGLMRKLIMIAINNDYMIYEKYGKYKLFCTNILYLQVICKNICKK